MSMLKQIQELESQMFDCIEFMYQSKAVKVKGDFNLALAVLENLNDEYFELTKAYYIPQEQMLEYHSKKWEF